MTAIPAWESGKTYPPGSLVVPASGTITVASQPTNADFESGSLTGWTDDGALFAISSFDPYSGTYVANASGGGTDRLVNDTIIPCTPGDRVTVTAFAKLTNNGTDDLGAQTNIIWVDGTGTPVGTASLGNLIYGKGGFWTASTCSDRVPDGATGFKVGLGVNTGSHGGSVAFDHVYVSYVYAGPPLGIAYKAVQAAPGKSGSTEPAWPGVLGETVVDNQVTWEAVVATRLVWKASPIMTSGATEPTWPTATGASVRDGTIDWVASTAQITDTNCPQSKIVQIAAGKVYAGDDDIVRYSATVNPKDWSTVDDAGFLPFGMNTYGSNPVAAMDLYRSNLVPFNAEGFQMWQVDTDPANSSLLDAMPLACNYRRATSPVSTDLLFLTSEGVRSIGIAGASTNLEAGDVGMPIDDLVLPYLNALVSDEDPLATYLPALGQYWLAFPSPVLQVATDLYAALVSWWPMNESNGTRYDAKGVNNLDIPPVSESGSITGAPGSGGAWIVGARGNFISRAAANCIGLDDASSMEIVSWVSESQITGVAGDIVSKMDSGHSIGYSLQVGQDAAPGSKFGPFFSTSNSALPAASMTPATFQMISGYRDPAARGVTVNAGAETVTESGVTTSVTSSYDFSIGSRWNYSTYGNPTYIGQTAFFNRKLTAAERNYLYNNGAGVSFEKFQSDAKVNTEVFVYTINRIGQAGKWSRYLFPFRIDNFATQDKTLLIRSGDDVLAYDSTAVTDYASDPREVTFDGIVQTPWLDMGPPGENKMLVGFDLVAEGSPSVAIGYDQSNTSTFTTDFAVPADTVPGMIIPLPVVAPSMSVRVTFTGGSKWKLQGINLYVEDLGT